MRNRNFNKFHGNGGNGGKPTNQVWTRPKRAQIWRPRNQEKGEGSKQGVQSDHLGFKTINSASKSIIHNSFSALESDGDGEGEEEEEEDFIAETQEKLEPGEFVQENELQPRTTTLRKNDNLKPSDVTILKRVSIHKEVETQQNENIEQGSSSSQDLDSSSGEEEEEDEISQHEASIEPGILRQLNEKVKLKAKAVQSKQIHGSVMHKKHIPFVVEQKKQKMAPRDKDTNITRGPTDAAMGTCNTKWPKHGQKIKS
ncbi:hypothetical protein FRX31_006867 [Thalictrum thalictroides]|uniref:Uncharacterized protein n=1 Tax=Thalictrum thalictroides TaxID=46969 RepID=A0A7J6X419_THATH|nr:hypothetical protein FRX31_006867 [Thalictrum thalictroides]